MKNLLITFLILTSFPLSHLLAKPTAKVAVSGFDAVAYFSEGTAKRGSGFHISTYEDAVYLFSSEENKKAFDKEPEKYLPQYGGYCAFGMALGKTFNADPEVWKIVEGKLYLNLNKDIQAKWDADLKSQISKGNQHWKNL